MSAPGYFVCALEQTARHHPLSCPLTWVIGTKSFALILLVVGGIPTTTTAGPFFTTTTALVIIVIIVFIIFIIILIILIAIVVSITVQIEKYELAWVARVSLDGHETAVVHDSDEDHLVGRAGCVDDCEYGVGGGAEDRGGVRAEYGRMGVRRRKRGQVWVWRE